MRCRLNVISCDLDGRPTGYLVNWDNFEIENRDVLNDMPCEIQLNGVYLGRVIRIRNVSEEQTELCTRLMDKCYKSFIAFANEQGKTVRLDRDYVESIFKEIEIKSTPVRVEAGSEDSGALLRSQSVSNMNKEIFRQLKSTVTAIRTSFVS